MSAETEEAKDQAEKAATDGAEGAAADVEKDAKKVLPKKHAGKSG